MFDIAYAMGQGGATGGQGAGSFTAFVPLILMFIIFYFLLIRPQQKKQKEHQQMVSNLKKGDRVVTASGIYGTITGIDENTIQLEVADRVRIKMLRSNVAVLEKGTAQVPAKKDKDEKKD